MAAEPTFSGASLDRAAEARHDPQWVARQLSDPRGRAVAARDDSVLLDADAQALLRIEAPARSGRYDGEPVLLGIEHERPLFALDLDALEPVEAKRLTDGARTVALREAGALLPHAESGL